MKRFTCECGQRVFFDNTQCGNCQRLLGFDPVMFDMRCQHEGQNEWGYCRNHGEYDTCNWLAAANQDGYCLACSMNHVIPNLYAPENRHFWGLLEISKRRLIYSLLRLGLPVAPQSPAAPDGMAFAFLEDRQRNPSVIQELVLTGYTDGLITINLAEADSVSLEQARVDMGESYRTLLGHFRHESGHHYFQHVVVDAGRLQAFRELFGDEQVDYQAALQRHYAGESTGKNPESYISAYAQSHPSEDWAECWAHFLHIFDTLETAEGTGLVSRNVDVPLGDSFDDWIGAWFDLVVALNELNRSMGLVDLYPFILGDQVIEKLRFVHSLLDPKNRPRQPAAAYETPP